MITMKRTLRQVSILHRPSDRAYSFKSAAGPFSNIKGLTYYRNNDEDPYITMKDVRFRHHLLFITTNDHALIRKRMMNEKIWKFSLLITCL